MTKYIKLSNRSIISIVGSDATKFIQSIISCDINKLNDESEIIIGLFLSPKGKFKFEAFIKKITNGYALEVDNNICDALQKLILFYKLRADINITIDNDVEVYNIITNKELNITGDPRMKSSLYRSYNKEDVISMDELSYDEWNVFRITHKLLNADDIIFEEDTPISLGYDDMGAISYDKGCFLGQEGTNKAKHKDILKEKIYALVSCDEQDIIFDTENKDIVNKEGRKIGNIRNTVSCYAIAMMKIKYIDEDMLYNGQNIKILSI